MHWLGMIIGRLGGEPNLTPAPYPHDPTSRATMLKSYIVYEEKLIPHYNGEADKVDDPHIKRVLQREAWESALHARKFQRKMDKLSPEAAAGLPGQASEMPQDLLNALQAEITSKYTEMLQHIRISWIFQQDDLVGWRIMDQAMEKMKQLAHFAEPVAEDGVPPEFTAGRIDKDQVLGEALKNALENVQAARKRHLQMEEIRELKEHSGLAINLDLTTQQEAYQAAELEDWRKSIKR